MRGYVVTKTFAKERIPFLHPLYVRFVRQYVRKRRQLLNARYEPRGPRHSSQRLVRQGGSKHKGGNETSFRLRPRCSPWP